MKITSILHGQSVRKIAPPPTPSGRRPYVQVVPLFFRSDGAVFGYFRDHADEIDAITGEAVHVVVPRSLVEGDARDIASALDAQDRYPGLKATDLPCLWVESSGGQHFVLPVPADLGEVKRLVQQLVEAARQAQSFGDVAGAFQPRQVTTPPGKPAKHVLMSLHGIETRGAWQKELQASCDQAEAGLQHRPLDFGLFRALSLLLPSMRARKVEWFLREYTRTVKEEQLGGRAPSIIAHSFGSYIVSRAMEQYPEIRFERIILCGSIVRRDYPWHQRFERGQVQRVLNDYGRRDIWVRVAETVIEDAGSSGYRGFDDSADARLIQRRHEHWRHSDYFYALNYDRNWIPFLAGVHDPDTGDTPAQRRTNWRFRVFQGLAALALAAVAYWLWRRYGAPS